MKLDAVILKNFRAFRDEVRIPIDDLTAFVGRNDTGKSSILEAVGIFLSSDQVEFDASDRCVHGGTESRIGCVFSDLPDPIVIDATASTSLAMEHLLNADGQLEIHRVWDCRNSRVKASVVARAMHPSAPRHGDLLTLKHEQLKARARDLRVDLGDADQRTSSEIRRAIWASADDLQPALRDIPLDGEDLKAIWARLQESLPLFALFRADRESTDEDAEAQDPLKLAVKQALAELAPELGSVKAKVEEKAVAVAARTLTKLRELDPALANTLKPVFREEPKWAAAFKLALEGDHGIPLNKRGSGLRRLVLLSFFRAEVERKQQEVGKQSIIYAIEEPEASQHPDNQRMLVAALNDLAALPQCQVLLTTHVPELAGLVPVKQIRLVRQAADSTSGVDPSSDGTYAEIAKTLGVLPDPELRALVCVEGPHDVETLKHFSRILHEADSTIPDLASTVGVAFLPMGGSTLKAWVNQRQLRIRGAREVHLYDRGFGPAPQYAAQAALVNARSDESVAFITALPEMENYLHESAVSQVYGLPITLPPGCDVPVTIAKAVHNADGARACDWDALPPEKQESKEGRAKERLSKQVASQMTPALFDDLGIRAEVESWLRQVESALRV